MQCSVVIFFFFSSRRRHTIFDCDWSSDVCSSDLVAVELVARAVRARTPILVHGDYDVDGQCGAALLTRVLSSAGGAAHAFVPHRLRDGYDFGEAGLREAQRLGAGLIITCDCGITATAAVR